MPTEKSRAFEERKRRHVEEITERFHAEFASDPNKALAPWTEFERPVNALTGMEYRGQNVFTLNWAKASKGYSRHSWLTYKQAEELGGVVRKGEKNTTIMRAITRKPQENEATRQDPAGGKDPSDGSSDRFIGFDFAFVFNIEQCERLRLADVAAEGANRSIRPISTLDNIITSMHKQIVFGKNESSLGEDGNTINFPSRAAFGYSEDKSAAERFYSGIMTLIRRVEINQRSVAGSDEDRQLASILIASRDCSDCGLLYSLTSVPDTFKSSVLLGRASLRNAIRIYSTMSGRED
jgi:antirestriction protein ArdC